MILVPLMLNGCAGPLAAISAIASVAGAAHSLYQAGGDIVAATAVACQGLPAAQAAEQRAIAAGRLTPDKASTPWYGALCNDLRPEKLDTGSPAWVSAGLSKIPG